MELISALAFAGTITTALVGIGTVLRRKARAGSWRSAAKRLKLSEIAEVPRSGLTGPALTARSGPLSVRLEHYRRGKAESGTRILVDGLGHGAEGLTLRREGISTRLFGSEIALGDPVFDREVHVQGPPALALAVLDPKTRERVAEILRGRVATLRTEWIPLTVELDRGVLEARLDESGLERTEQLCRALRHTLTAARLLSAPEDLPAQLAKNYRNEPEAGVRLQIVTLLAREYPDHPEARKALRTALRDVTDETCLRAATALGEEGRAALTTFVEDPTIEDSSAARAVTTLGDRLAPRKREGALARALQLNRSLTAQACLATLSRSGHAAAESLALQALGHADSDIATAAAQALGRFGRAEAVAPLREKASAVLPSALRSAARQAIAEIQSRLTGAAPGQLALADGEVGNLSLAAQEQGGLSLADPQPSEHPIAAEPPAGHGTVGAGHEAES